MIVVVLFWPKEKEKEEEKKWLYFWKKIKKMKKRVKVELNEFYLGKLVKR